MENTPLPKKMYAVLILPFIIFMIALIFQWNRISQLTQTVGAVSQTGLTISETQNLFPSGQIPYLKSVNGLVEAINKNLLTIKVTVPDFSVQWPDPNNPPMIQKIYAVAITQDTKVLMANPKDINRVTPIASDQIKIGNIIQIQSEENIWNQITISAKEILIIN
ncbi:MAG TPA: hypothetical protein VJH70_02390 [Candidatus Paceibacterota bacterium]